MFLTANFKRISEDLSNKLMFLWRRLKSSNLDLYLRGIKSAGRSNPRCSIEGSSPHLHICFVTLQMKKNHTIYKNDTSTFNLNICKPTLLSISKRLRVLGPNARFFFRKSASPPRKSSDPYLHSQMSIDCSQKVWDVYDRSKPARSCIFTQTAPFMQALRILIA